MIVGTFDIVNGRVVALDSLPEEKKSSFAGEINANDAKDLIEKCGEDPAQFNLDQFVQGYKTEREHADLTNGDPVMTAKIVIAHLKEKADYYAKLAKVEGEDCSKTGDGGPGSGVKGHRTARMVRNVEKAQQLAGMKKRLRMFRQHAHPLDKPAIEKMKAEILSLEKEAYIGRVSVPKSPTKKTVDDWSPEARKKALEARKRKAKPIHTPGRPVTSS